MNFTVDHRLVRGLDYYTKTVFEIQPPGEKGSQSTIGGGGRYDDLIEELSGKAIPAVGFATGFERMILNLKNHNIQVSSSATTTAFVAFLGDLLYAVLSRSLLGRTKTPILTVGTFVI